MRTGGNMSAVDSRALEHVSDQNKGPRHAILIDPADQTPDVAGKRAVAAVAAGSEMILVGGSSGTDMENVNRTVVAIQEALELVAWASSQDSGLDEKNWKVPVVLFPQGSTALSPAADAITFMMLMNSKSPKFLIEEQVAGSLFIKKAGISPLPMGYIICAPGGKAGEVGMADLIQPSEIERIAAYATTAEYYGFKIIYLEAGSGAKTPVSPDLIKSARESCNLTIVVGGGIRDGKTAKIAVDAGADWIITGNLTESFDNADELQRALAIFIDEMNN
jgi:phosphoglycerol geranylgeranyltransferase